MNTELATIESIKGKMLEYKGQYVLLDSDVAQLYGVETKQINQAVRRNPERFPDGYVLELDNKESTVLRSKVLTLEQGKGHYSKYNFKAFTERGLYMLATILKSPRAVQTTIAIIETYAKVREMARTMEALQNVEDGGMQQSSLLQRSGELLADVVGSNLATESTETEIELNFAVVKIKHKVTRKHPDDHDNKGNHRS